jgi:DnaJ-class molecular chaperone
MLITTKGAAERLCFGPYSVESRQKDKILRHYRLLALLVHPDKVKSADKAGAQEAFQALTSAKDTLLSQANTT